MALLNFTGEGVKEMDESDPIPANTYIAQIIKSEMIPTKAGTGVRLNFTFKVLEGEFAGRVVFAGLNWKNPSKQAVEISMRELKSISTAAGYPNGVQNSEDLHGKPMEIKVSVKPGNEEYPDAKNEIKGYYPIGNAKSGNATPEFVGKGGSGTSEDSTENEAQGQEQATGKKPMWD